MASLGQRITVTTSPTIVAQAPRQTRNSEPMEIVVVLPATPAVDFGGSAVATGAGFSPAASSVFTFHLANGDALYAVAASGTAVVQVLNNYA